MTGFHFGYTNVDGSALDVRRETTTSDFSFLVREGHRAAGTNIVQPGPIAQVRLTPSTFLALCTKAGDHMGLSLLSVKADVDADADRLPPAVAWRAAHIRAAYRLLPADTLIDDVIALAQYIGEGKR